MGILKTERKILHSRIEKSFSMGLKIGEYQNIYRKRKIWNRVKLSREQKKLIQNYFVQHYGKKYSDKWHRLYQSYTGTFDEKYFPEILFSTKLESKLNSRSISSALQDKNLLEPLYQSVEGLRIPKTLMGNSYGTYYVAEGKGRKITDLNSACKFIEYTDPVIIKPAVGTSSGKGVIVCEFCNGIDIYSGKTVKQILKPYNENFVVQEYITNCKELSALYSGSLNTIRVITYILDGKLYHLPLGLRLGRNGSKVDNGHAGGLGIGISEEGYLNKYAFLIGGKKFSRHPNSKIAFHKYYIPNVSKAVEIAYQCHSKTPQLKIISWDLSIDENENVVLIEANMFGQSIWPPQFLNGKSAFGENTSKMLRLIRRK